MQVKTLRSFIDGSVRVGRGVLLDINDYKATQLVRKGLAAPVMAEATKPKAPAGNADTGPSAEVGPTGEAAPPYSLPEVQPQPTRASKRRARRTVDEDGEGSES